MGLLEGAGTARGQGRSGEGDTNRAVVRHGGRRLGATAPAAGDVLASHRGRQHLQWTHMFCQLWLTATARS